MSLYPYQNDENYQASIRAMLENQSVCLLVSPDGEAAECPSTEYDGDDGEPVPVICVWHDENAATQCQAQEWDDYQIEVLPLSFFLNEWVIGLDQDAQLLGVDFDAELYGIEIEPIDFLADILDLAQEMECAHMIENYDELMAYRLEWERTISGQSHLN